MNKNIREILYMLDKDRAAKALRTLLEEVIPEELYFDDPILAEHNKEFTTAYNQALTEVRAALGKLFEGE